MLSRVRNNYPQRVSSVCVCVCVYDNNGAGRVARVFHVLGHSYKNVNRQVQRDIRSNIHAFSELSRKILYGHAKKKVLRIVSIRLYISISVST